MMEVFCSFWIQSLLQLVIFLRVTNLEKILRCRSLTRLPNIFREIFPCPRRTRPRPRTRKLGGRAGVDADAEAGQKRPNPSNLHMKERNERRNHHGHSTRLMSGRGGCRRGRGSRAEAMVVAQHYFAARKMCLSNVLVPSTMDACR